MFLTDEHKTEIKKHLGDLKNETELILFSQNIGCQYCKETEILLKELTETLNNIKLTVYNPVLDEEISKKYGITKETPVIAIKSESNPNSQNVKFFGIPAEYEFTWLLSLINMVSNDIYPLQPSTVENIRKIDQILEKNSAVLELIVLVTPSCPYCPIMTINSTAFSLLAKNIKASLVEVVEFPEYAQEYSVMGVPKTVIKLKKKDGTEISDSVEGALPENRFVEKLLNLVEKDLEK
ncbi:MAG: thioredoxin family protein [bacterium]